MNIEAYDAESLRKLVRTLEYENRILKDKLKKENIPYDEVNPFEEIIDSVEEYDPDQGGRFPVWPGWILGGRQWKHCLRLFDSGHRPGWQTDCQ